MIIRTASPEDAPELLGIYAPYVRDTAVTFEYQVPSQAEFTDRIRRITEKYPCLAAQDGSRLLGYTYASVFKDRAAYSWSVETTIYVDREARRRGIGKRLYAALEDCLRRQNICSLCACIAYPNPDSIGFHESLGYRTVAHFHDSGFKQGTWYDMVWMEKELCPHTVPPKPFIPFPNLNRQRQ